MSRNAHSLHPSHLAPLQEISEEVADEHFQTIAQEIEVGPEEPSGGQASHSQQMAEIDLRIENLKQDLHLRKNPHNLFEALKAIESRSKRISLQARKLLDLHQNDVNLDDIIKEV